MFTRKQITDMLNNGPVTVKFTKVTTGEQRTMRCTLNESLIPSDQLPIGGIISNAVEPGDLVPVFDLDQNSWRSFYIDTVTNAEKAA